VNARPSILLRLLLALIATLALACVLIGMRLWSANHLVPETVRLTELASAPPIPVAPPPPPAMDARDPTVSQAAPPLPAPPADLQLPQLELEMVPVSIPLRSTQVPKLELLRPRFDLIRPAPPKPEPVKIVPPTPPKPVPLIVVPPPVSATPRPLAPTPTRIEPPLRQIAPPSPYVPPRPAPVRMAPAPPSPPAPAPISAPADSRIQVSELDQTPRLLNRPSVRFPSKLSRSGVREGRVTLEVTISTSGKVSVDRVINSSHPAHPELEAAARSFAARARFSKPTKGGRPVQAVFHWPLVLKP